ncbi:MAG: tyrosine-type recombinase/integrase [Hormoscilla sp. GM102CHS1]|nr:tyrosine-type recombinase/integrase [Hormoscilla sp. GM102CHS1]
MNINALTRADSDREIILIWLGDKSRTTQVSYRSIVSQFLLFVAQPLSDVALEDLQLLHRRLQLTDQPHTVANKIRAIKSLFSFCVKVGYLQVNVGSFIKCPKVKDKLAERVLSADECKKLIGATRNHRDRALLSLMYACELRVSEVCNLTWNDLQPHLDGGKATIFGKGAETAPSIGAGFSPLAWDCPYCSRDFTFKSLISPILPNDGPRCNTARLRTKTS